MSRFKHRVVERLDREQLLEIALAALEVAYPLCWDNGWGGISNDGEDARWRLRQLFEQHCQEAVK